MWNWNFIFHKHVSLEIQARKVCMNYRMSECKYFTVEFMYFIGEAVKSRNRGVDAKLWNSWCISFNSIMATKIRIKKINIKLIYKGLTQQTNKTEIKINKNIRTI